MSIELVMPSNHLVLCHLLLLPLSIFPSIRVFSKKMCTRSHLWGHLQQHLNTAKGGRQPKCVSTVLCVLSHVLLFVIPWTEAHQAPLCMEFSRQEYWSGMSFPSHSQWVGHSQPRDQTRVSGISCFGRQILYHVPPRKPISTVESMNKSGYNKIGKYCYENEQITVTGNNAKS